MGKDYLTKMRQRELYEELEKIGDGSYVDQEEIVSRLTLYPIVLGKNFHDSTARRLLSQDIQEINGDPNFQRIILSSPGSKGIKLANAKEAQDYIEKQKISCMKKLLRFSAIANKVSLAGQYDLEGEEYGI